MKNKIKDFLIYHNYLFTEKANLFLVSINRLEIILIVEDDNKLIVENELIPWNPISGMISTNLRKALKINSVLIIIGYLIVGFYESWFAFSILSSIVIVFGLWYLFYLRVLFLFEVKLNNWIHKSN